MSIRETIQIPSSPHNTRVEVWYKGELNRAGGVQPDTTEVVVKLPAEMSECEIRLIPMDPAGNAINPGIVYAPPIAPLDPLEADVADEEAVSGEFDTVDGDDARYLDDEEDDADCDNPDCPGTDCDDDCNYLG